MYILAKSFNQSSPKFNAYAYAYAWQGLSDLFQTFEKLDDFRYIDEEIQAVSELLAAGEIAS
jgi:hypothetical protein